MRQTIQREVEGAVAKMILTGDIFQIDTPYLDAQSNGLSYLIDRLKEARERAKAEEEAKQAAAEANPDQKFAIVDVDFTGEGGEDITYDRTYEVVDRGLARHLGVSNFAAWQLLQCQWLADVHDWESISALDLQGDALQVLIRSRLSGGDERFL